MILPSDQRDRNALYQNSIRECLTSSDRRRAHNKRLRTLALNGSETSAPVRRNKLIEFVETSSAYCYAPEFVKFGVTLPSRYGDQWIEEIDAVRAEVGDLFLDSDMDKAYGLMVDWAHIYPSMFGKVLVSDHRVVLEPITDPADLGVWEETLPSLSKQEAMVHRFDMNLKTVERLIRQAIPSRAEADELCGKARQHAIRGPSGAMLAPAIPRIVLAQASPNLIGAVHGMGGGNLGEPEVQVDIVPMCELWVRDDLAYAACKTCGHRESDFRHESPPLGDHNFVESGEHEWEWRKVLAMGQWGDDPLWGSLNPLLPQQLPFQQLNLGPVTNYLWGLSPLEKLIMMQLWGEGLIGKHDQLLDLQLDPPIAIIGLSNVDGERAKLLRAPGGTFTMPVGPGAEIKRLAPETPPDAAGMTRLIDDWFDRAGGLPMGSQGQSEANVRSAGQMTAGAMLSSPRTNRRAMLVEDTLEDIMTDALRLHRRISKDPLRVNLKDKDPQTGEMSRNFYLSQVPGDLTVRVSSHSASPLHRNQMREDAVVLKREGVIDGETFAEVYPTPMEDVVRSKARRLAAAAAQFKERALQIKQEEADAKKVAAESKAAKVTK